jgi:hypothetical protein
MDKTRQESIRIRNGKLLREGRLIIGKQVSSIGNYLKKSINNRTEEKLQECQTC